VIRRTGVPDWWITLAFIRPCTLTTVVTNLALPGANVVIHPRVFSSFPFLSTLVLCSPARNCFSSDLISSFSKAFGAPPRSVGQSRFPAISISRVVS
jgi:hypothetical protein